MDIKIIENLDYSKYQDRIVAFLNEHDHYTIFHDPRFLSYHKYSDRPINEYQFMDIIVEKSGIILAYLPGGIDTKNNTFISHKGASFAGPIFSKHLKISEKLNILKQLLEYLKTRHVTKCKFKLTPSFYLNKTHFNDELEWILYSLNFRQDKYDLTCTLKPVPDAELNSVLSRNAKRNYKKAQANKLVIDTSGDVNIFYDIVKKIEKNLMQRQHIPLKTLNI